MGLYRLHRHGLHCIDMSRLRGRAIRAAARGGRRWPRTGASWRRSARRARLARSGGRKAKGPSSTPTTAKVVELCRGPRQPGMLGWPGRRVTCARRPLKIEKAGGSRRAPNRAGGEATDPRTRPSPKPLPSPVSPRRHTPPNTPLNLLKSSPEHPKRPPTATTSFAHYAARTNQLVRPESSSCRALVLVHPSQSGRVELHAHLRPAPADPPQPEGLQVLQEEQR